MVEVEFAPSLRRHVECSMQRVQAGSLATVLEAALLAAPRLTHYVFDDQKAIRKHVAVFINQKLIIHRNDLSEAVADGDRVLVIQALSGG